MKYAQMIMGLLVGTALGGTVVAATGNTAVNGGTVNQDEVKKIVRETIMQEPKLIIDAVQKYQEDQRKQSSESASKALEDSSVRKAVYDDSHAGTYGPKDSKRVVIQFFDYNCPACKAQHKALAELIGKDKNVRLVFREYPIFGPTSEYNSRIGFAVAHLAPEKYYAFYEKMMNHQGHAEEKDVLGYVKELGLDVEKIKADSTAPEIAKLLEENRALGEKLHIQGTPTIIIGDEVIPHAIGPDELEEKLKKIK